MESFLMEKANAKQVLAPGSIQTAPVSTRISMANADRVAFLVSLGTSTGATVQLTLRQHTAAAGGTSKDLAVANPYFVKGSADTKFTKTEPAVAAALVDASAKFAADSGLVVVEVLAEQLDVNAGFGHVSLEVGAAGVAKSASIVAILGKPKSGPGYDQAF